MTDNYKFLATGNEGPPPEQDLEKLRADWITATCPSEDSQREYLKGWNRLCRSLGPAKMLTLSQDDIGQWLDTFINSAKSQRYVRQNWMVARSWVSWCVARGLRPPVPPWRRFHARAYRVDAAAVTPLRGLAGRRTSLTLAEARRVLRWAETQPQDKKTAILLMMVAGLRAIEVHRAKWEDLAKGIYGVQVLTVWGKGKKSRQVALEPVLAKAIENLRQNTITAQLIPVSRRTLQRWGKAPWIIVGRKHQGAGHGLRRTCATLLVERGAGLDQVQGLLGHSSISTTAACYVARHKRLTTTTGIGGRK